MFWSKARKIKELEFVVRDQEKILVARLNSLKVKQEEIDQAQKWIFEANQKIPALAAERDQLFKKVEDLQAHYQESETIRDVNGHLHIEIEDLKRKLQEQLDQIGRLELVRSD